MAQFNSCFQCDTVLFFFFLSNKIFLKTGFSSQLQAALQDVGIEREEKASALKQAQASKELYSQAIERQHAAEERLSVILEESKQAKLHSDTLIQCYKVSYLKMCYSMNLIWLTLPVLFVSNPVINVKFV